MYERVRLSTKKPSVICHVMLVWTFVVVEYLPSHMLHFQSVKPKAELRPHMGRPDAMCVDPSSNSDPVLSPRNSDVDNDTNGSEDGVQFNHARLCKHL